jgi:signal transduction histidine kinase
MRKPVWWRSPIAMHAVRVAVTATVMIGVMYVCIVAAFDAVDRHRQVSQIDARLDLRLDHASSRPAAAASIDNYDNAHDVDDSLVFMWRVGSSGPARRLISGSPALRASSWSPAHQETAARLGNATFALQAQRVGAQWLVAGQSLAEVDHVASDLITLEVVAGPVLLLAVFLGTFLVGIKAASPVESARRRQLEFTADASHELRTPLSVIEAEVSLALNGTRTADDYRDTLERVNRESRRLRTIVEDLLWLSRFDSEPPPPGVEPVDVSAIATACADRFDHIAAGKSIALSVHRRGEGQPWINAPPEWVDRLTAVLVDNACRYAGSRGIVQITVSTQGNRVSLVVEDNGPGIAPADRAQLFDRFHRATDEGNGAGLGLAIGDAVVRATAGEWSVGEALLGGARMEVRWHRSPGAKEIVDESNTPVPQGTDADADLPMDHSLTG